MPNDAAGTFRGGVRVEGSLSDPLIRGGVRLNNLAIPRWNLSHVSGVIKAPDWFNPPGPGSQMIEGSLNLDIAKATVKKLNVTNLNGTISPASNSSYNLKVMGNLARGSFQLNGLITKDGDLKGHIQFNGLDADTLLAGLLDAPKELTGTMDLDLDLHTSVLAFSRPDFLRTANASGTVKIANGSLARVGLLKRKINQANLLKSGVLGFNFNNVLASVATPDSGDFDQLSSQFQLRNGRLNFEKFALASSDFRLQADGLVDLNNDKVKMQALGTVARVATGGPLGFVAPFLGVEKITDVVSDIPSIITAGSKAGSTKENASSARPFAFTANGTLKNTDTVSESIYKSFHWLTTTTSEPQAPKTRKTSTHS